ncbi:MAG: hypothetical protein MJZ34_02710 [Paludibacteraceae bacterium]|nr:hypothetical protein [Paludibacteraceae bacterium]
MNLVNDIRTYNFADPQAIEVPERITLFFTEINNHFIDVLMSIGKQGWSRDLDDEYISVRSSIKNFMTFTTVHKLRGNPDAANDYDVYLNRNKSKWDSKDFETKYQGLSAGPVRSILQNTRKVQNQCFRTMVIEGNSVHYKNDLNRLHVLLYHLFLAMALVEKQKQKAITKVFDVNGKKMTIQDLYNESVNIIGKLHKELFNEDAKIDKLKIEGLDKTTSLKAEKAVDLTKATAQSNTSTEDESDIAQMNVNTDRNFKWWEDIRAVFDKINATDDLKQSTLYKNLSGFMSKRLDDIKDTKTYAELDTIYNSVFGAPNRKDSAKALTDATRYTAPKEERLNNTDLSYKGSEKLAEKRDNRHDRWDAYHLIKDTGDFTHNKFQEYLKRNPDAVLETWKVRAEKIWRLVYLLERIALIEKEGYNRGNLKKAEKADELKSTDWLVLMKAHFKGLPNKEPYIVMHTGCPLAGVLFKDSLSSKDKDTISYINDSYRKLLDPDDGQTWYKDAKDLLDESAARFLVRFSRACINQTTDEIKDELNGLELLRVSKGTHILVKAFREEFVKYREKKENLIDHKNNKLAERAWCLYSLLHSSYKIGTQKANDFSFAEYPPVINAVFQKTFEKNATEGRLYPRVKEKVTPWL